MSNVNLEEKFISVFGENEYRVMQKTNILKFSKWDVPREQIMLFSQKLTNGENVIPETKYFVYIGWYVFYYVENGVKKFGVGHDPDLKPDFNLMQE
jgi:hypothetical protein